MDHDAIAREVEERFGAFFRQVVNPGAAERDRTCTTFPVEMLKQMADLGLIGFTAPRSVGGAGRTWEEWGHALEEIGYRCDDSGLPMLLSYRETAINLVHHSALHGRPHLIERYVRPAVRGEAFIGWLFTEETDLLRFDTRVEKRGDKWILNGRKTASTGGATCTSWMVYPSSDEGRDSMVFMIHRDDPGVEVRPLPSLGLRSIGLSELTFTDVELDEDRILAPTDGISHGQLFVNERRVTGAAWLLGRMRSLIEKVVADTEGKVRFGRSLIELDTFKGAIGRMAIALETARSTAYRAFAVAEALREDHAYIHDPIIAIAKYTSTEAAIEVADTAQRLTGGHGYFEKYGMERYLRDFYGLVPILGGQPSIETQVGATWIWKQQRRASRRPASES